MKECMPEAYRELVENCEILERHYKDMMVWIPIFCFVLLYLFIYFYFVSSLSFYSLGYNLREFLLFVLGMFVSWN